MPRDLVIVGCGGFGREVVGIVDAINASGGGPRWNLLGFVDDAPSTENISRLKSLDIPLLGGASAIQAQQSSTAFVIAIGDPAVKRRVARSLGADDRAATLVDPGARVGRGVRLGAGVVVAAGAHVTTNVVIDDYVHVDRAVQVGHDSAIGRFSSLHPASVVSGDCTIGHEVRLGTGATVLPGVRVGPGAFVGAGACVTKNVPAAEVVWGVPAR